MSSILLTILVVALLVVLTVFFQKQRRIIEELRQAREELQLEESRVFDFLHGLGTAFSDDLHLADLHRLIVEGAMRILDAHAGALYLVDRPGKLLLPTFLSPGCPPLIEVPKPILQQSITNPSALESFVRLHPVKRGDGLLGMVWEKQEPVFLSNSDYDSRLESLKASTSQIDSVLVAPLLYGNQNLGVLAVANEPMSTPFTAADFIVFQSIVEQSAFALCNAMVYSEAAEKRRIDRDLDVARDIQRILLPAAPPEIPGYQIAGINIPASQVSGDYYDYIPVSDSRYGIAIADVCGKGVAASLIMAMCRSVLRSVARLNTSAAQVLHEVNRQLYPDIREDMFISMAYLIAEKSSENLILARAGHDAPLLYQASTGSVEKVNPAGMALGIDSGNVFDRVTADCTIRLERGDCLILYTDGVTEALDFNGIEFGIGRLIEVIKESANESAQAIVARVTEKVKAFVGNNPQTDDITLVAIRKI
jgi:phosphoserine phosphatase RsbU/P